MLKMKKPSRLVMALALCLLLSTSYGIRLPRESNPSTIQQINDVEKSSILNDVKAVTICRDDEHCSPSSSSSSSSSFSSGGKYRNVMISTTSSSLSTPPSITISLKSLNNKSTPLEYSEATPAKSGDGEVGTDITAMDYSPATRKAPIHN